MKNTKKSALVVRSNVKAGGFTENHNRSLLKKGGLVVKSAVRAGGFSQNHNLVLVG
jgi:hypothetical protein